MSAVPIANGQVFTSVICACIARDIGVLTFSLPRLHRFIPTKTIDVVVPDAEVPIFRQRLREVEGVSIVAESSVVPPESRAQIGEVLAKAGLGRQTGWYYQQFLKVQRSAFYGVNDPVLIWDADTVPLRPINFFNTDGSFNFFVGTEYHPPYFETILRLLQTPKLTPYSFIAQCLPLTGGIAKEFIDTLGGNSQWVEKVLASLELKSAQEFSEYETLGQFMLARYPQVVRLCLFPWVRNGSREFYRYGSLDRAARELQDDFCFAAFERLAERGPVYFRRRILAYLQTKRRSST